ncbi:MAG: hypothetical protein IJ088_00970 [Clostridia bacterium]|nr:hypothetical protein [Clostridia bacterium]
MRCSCRRCGTYMIQAEGTNFGCVCPECLNRCRDCMGTNTVLSPDQLHAALSARIRADDSWEEPEEEVLGPVTREDFID